MLILVASAAVASTALPWPLSVCITCPEQDLCTTLFGCQVGQLMELSSGDIEEAGGDRGTRGFIDDEHAFPWDGVVEAVYMQPGATGAIYRPHGETYEMVASGEPPWPVQRGDVVSLTLNHSDQFAAQAQGDCVQIENDVLLGRGPCSPWKAVFKPTLCPSAIDPPWKPPSEERPPPTASSVTCTDSPWFLRRCTFSNMCWTPDGWHYVANAAAEEIPWVSLSPFADGRTKWRPERSAGIHSSKVNWTSTPLILLWRHAPHQLTHALSEMMLPVWGMLHEASLHDAVVGYTDRCSVSHQGDSLGQCEHISVQIPALCKDTSELMMELLDMRAGNVQDIDGVLCFESVHAGMGALNINNRPLLDLLRQNFTARSARKRASVVVVLTRDVVDNRDEVIKWVTEWAGGDVSVVDPHNVEETISAAASAKIGVFSHEMTFGAMFLQPGGRALVFPAWRSPMISYNVDIQAPADVSVEMFRVDLYSEIRRLTGILTYKVTQDSLVAFLNGKAAPVEKDLPLPAFNNMPDWPQFEVEGEKLSDEEEPDDSAEDDDDIPVALREPQCEIEKHGVKMPCFLECVGDSFPPYWGLLNYYHRQHINESALHIAQEIVNSELQPGSPVFDNIQYFRQVMMIRLTASNEDALLQGSCLFGSAVALQVVAQHGGELWTMDLFRDLVNGDPLDLSAIGYDGWMLNWQDVELNWAAAQNGSQKLGVWRTADSSIRGIPRPDLPFTEIHGPVNVLKRAGIVGFGDHLMGTIDVMYMLEKVLEEQGIAPVSKRIFGQFCQQSKAQKHQCRAKCEFFDCSKMSKHDPVDTWLRNVIDPKTFQSHNYQWDVQVKLLAALVPGLDVFNDWLVCSHPTALCLAISQVIPLDQTLIIHASSNIVYGAPGVADDVHLDLEVLTNWQYFEMVRNLSPATVLLAEGHFLAEQLRQMVDISVPTIPPLAMYVNATYVGDVGAPTFVIRTRFHNSVNGIMCRRLFELMGVLNGMEFKFVGTSRRDVRYYKYDDLAKYKSVILFPNDLTQRTFHEIYRMHIPLFIPDDKWLSRLQVHSNWGYRSYGANTNYTQRLAANGHPPFAWWARDALTDHVMYYMPLADWNNFPHILRFRGVAHFFTFSDAQILEASARMGAFHRDYYRRTLRSFSVAIR
eukprot:GEMP01003545.1.p1 GENE.GEMP01003545.1~~GEMP01003545.1.p1  ORF type:complete len:1146 (+),score=225.25 GEMP01003545.1:62-3499(+)